MNSNSIIVFKKSYLSQKDLQRVCNDLSSLFDFSCSVPSYTAIFAAISCASRASQQFQVRYKSFPRYSCFILFRTFDSIDRKVESNLNSILLRAVL